MTVALVLVARRVVVAWQDAFQQQALPLSGILLPISSTQGLVTVDLRAERRSKTGRTSWLTRINQALAGLAVTAMAGAFGVHVMALQQAQHMLAADIAAKAIQIRKVVALEAEADALTRRATFLARRDEVPSQMALLNELARRLPDDTWLVTWHQASHQLSVSGYATNAARLISLIDASPLFEHTKFRSPVITDGEGRLEHFDLSIDVRVIRPI